MVVLGGKDFASFQIHKMHFLYTRDTSRVRSAHDQPAFLRPCSLEHESQCRGSDRGP